MKKILKIFTPLLLVLGVFFSWNNGVEASYSAEYWNLPSPISTPSFPGGAADLSRTDATIDFNWAESSPAPGTINVDGFVARWTKTIGSGEYYFYISSDDGSRVKVDDALKLDMWSDQSEASSSVIVSIPTEGNHTLHVEYYENPGDAVMHFSYIRTIYANTSTGNDTTGDGTPESPYKTFEKADTMADSGDTIDLTDIVNPILSTFSPADGAVGIAVDVNLVITFDEPVERETGNILIKKTSDNSTVEIIDVTSGKLTGTGTRAITINPASTFDTETGYYIQIPATAFDDPSSNSFAGILDTTTWNFTTIDVTAPVISRVGTTPADTSVTIAWTTDEPASSQVEYGLTSAYGNNTLETNTSPRVTSHSVAFPSLNTCATYHYRVKSTDDSTNLSTGSDGTFTTTGCTGSAPVLTQIEQTVTKASGGTFQLNTGTADLTLQVPVNFAAQTSAEFQLHQITASNVMASIGAPSARESIIGNHTYSLLALTDLATTITAFDNPLTLTIAYTDDEISGLTESTLQIYRWNGAAWNELDNCSVDASANTVTCETSNFSTFGLFGSTITGGGSGVSCPEKANIFSLSPKKAFSEFDEFSFLMAPEKISSSWKDLDWVKNHLRITVGNTDIEAHSITLKQQDWLTALVSISLDQPISEKSEITITAQGDEGNEKCIVTQSFVVDVLPPAPLLDSVQEEANDPLHSSARKLFPRVPDFDPSPATEFMDTRWHWGEVFARGLRVRGVVKGIEPGIFAPDQGLTRAELTKIALLAFSFPIDQASQSSFPDVREDEWSRPYIATAEKYDIVNGYGDNTFRPHNLVSRAEAVKIVLEIAGLNLERENEYAFFDVVKDSWYEPYVLFAVEHDMIEGKGSLFLPNRPITRAEMAKLIVGVWKEL